MMQAVGREKDAVLDAYCTATPRSREAFERARRTMPGGAKGAYFYPPYPLTMQRGEGCYLYDVDNRQYVDFANHHTAQILGHCHPAVATAVQAQLAHGIVLGAPTGIETALAEEVCRRVPAVERVRFCNSGTEATLHAVRLARGFSQRPKIAKFEGAITAAMTLLKSASRHL
jgi:glutamate-1-semialdehyde 2,1-aminomutase